MAKTHAARNVWLLLPEKKNPWLFNCQGLPSRKEKTTIRNKGPTWFRRG
jgi:hypothetical protein